MNDKDFDDIGKRLYDLEADPPASGWETIKPRIHPEDDRGAAGYFRRHWWKPLVLLIPALVYLAMPSNETREKLAHTSIVAPSPDQQISTSSQTAPAPASASSQEDRRTDGTASGSSTAPVTDPTRANTSRENKTYGSSQAIAQKASGDRVNSTVKGSNGRQSQVVTEDNLNGPDHTEEKDAPEHTSVKPGYMKAIVSQVSANESNSAWDDSDRLKSESLTKQASATRTETNGDGDTREGENGSVTAISKAIHAEQNEKETASRGKEVDSTAGNTASRRDMAILGPMRPSVTVTADTIALQEQVSTMEGKEQMTRTVAEEDDKDQGLRNSWRLSFAFNPQFVFNRYRPQEDEVLVTGIRKGKELPERAGFSFSAGAGKSVSRNFAVDIQATITRVRQDVAFSYATGVVDTLLARSRGDGTVLVTPVYETEAYERTGQTTFGGLKMTATYYFWNNNRRRFNFSGGAGINTVLSRSFRTTGQAPLGMEQDLIGNRGNVTLHAGAGYSVMFSRGWELMVSPNLTYFVESKKTYTAPVSYNQHSYGIGVSLFRHLY